MEKHCCNSCGHNKVIAITIREFRGKHEVLVVADACCEACGNTIILPDITLAEFLQHENFIAEPHDLICPNCKSSLVVKKNSYTGEVFLGCSKYPKCKFTC